MDFDASRTTIDPSREFNPAHRDYFKKHFKTFDKDNSESIQTADVANALRMAGLAPTENVLKEAVEKADPSESGRCRFDDFLVAVGHVMLHLDGIEELKEAFRTFDPEGRGFISWADLRFILTSKGDKLGDEEMNEMFAEAAIDGDPDFGLRYDDLAQRIVHPFLRSV